MTSKYGASGSRRSSRSTFSRSPSVTIPNPAERLRISLSHSSVTPPTKRTRVSKSSHPPRRIVPASASVTRTFRSRNSCPMTPEATSNSGTKTCPAARGIAREPSTIQRRTISAASGRNAGYFPATFVARETRSSLKSTRVSPRSKRTNGFMAGTPRTVRDEGSKSASLPARHILAQRDFRTEGADHPIVVFVRRMAHLLAHRGRLLEFQPEDFVQSRAIVRAFQDRLGREGPGDHGIPEPETGDGILESSGFACEHRAVAEASGDWIWGEVCAAHDAADALAGAHNVLDPRQLERHLGKSEEPVEIELAPRNAVQRVESDPGRDREVSPRRHVVVEESVCDVSVQSTPVFADRITSAKDVVPIARGPGRGDVGVCRIDLRAEVKANSRRLRASEQDLIHGVLFSTPHEEVVSGPMDHVPSMGRAADRAIHGAEGRNVEAEGPQLIEDVPLAVVPNPLRVRS